MKGTVTTGRVRTADAPPRPLPLYEKITDLFLDKCQLFKIPFQERHLLLLSLAVAVSDDIVILFTNFVQLNLQFDHLRNKFETSMNEITRGHSPSHSGSVNP